MKRLRFKALLLRITRIKSVHQYYNNSMTFIYMYVHSNQPCDDFTFCNMLQPSVAYRCVNVRTSGNVLKFMAERNITVSLNNFNYC
jgi:hypothetical protein